MAAFAFESGNLVWQKVAKALLSANPGVAASFKALRQYVVEQKGNPDCQFIPFTAAAIDTGTDGLVAGTGTGKLLGVYFKRVSDVDTTSAFNEVFDDATDNSTAANALVILRTTALNQERAWIDPVGISLATGLVVSSTTVPAGTTESAATESSNGFLVVQRP
jgi:hypothetical protein